MEIKTSANSLAESNPSTYQKSLPQLKKFQAKVKDQNYSFYHNQPISIPDCRTSSEESTVRQRKIAKIPTINLLSPNDERKSIIRKPSMASQTVFGTNPEDETRIEAGRNLYEAFESSIQVLSNAQLCSEDHRILELVTKQLDDDFTRKEIKQAIYSICKSNFRPSEYMDKLANILSKSIQKKMCNKEIIACYLEDENATTPPLISQNLIDYIDGLKKTTFAEMLPKDMEKVLEKRKLILYFKCDSSSPPVLKSKTPKNFLNFNSVYKSYESYKENYQIMTDENVSQSQIKMIERSDKTGIHIINSLHYQKTASEKIEKNVRERILEDIDMNKEGKIWTWLEYMLKFSLTNFLFFIILFSLVFTKVAVLEMAFTRPDLKNDTGQLYRENYAPVLPLALGVVGSDWISFLNMAFLYFFVKDPGSEPF